MKHFLTILTIFMAIFLTTTTGFAADRIYSHQAAPSQQLSFTTQPGYRLNLPSSDWFVIEQTFDNPGEIVIRYAVKQNTTQWMRTTNLSVENPNQQPQVYTIFQYGKITPTSSASYNPDKISPGQIATLFGSGMATTTTSPSALPLPTDVAGTTITLIHELTRAKFEAPLLYVSPIQINFIVPDQVPIGLVTIVIRSPINTATGVVQLSQIAPDLFTSNQQGSGEAVSSVQFNNADGTVEYQNGVGGVEVRGNGTKTFLLLYATGIRGNNQAIPDRAIIGDTEVRVIYASAQGFYIGLDQVTLEIPESLRGKGRLPAQILIDGMPTNPVEVIFR